eukprot:Nitzschia sp. Nitz4//scaffold202_size38995//29154//30538//NITZ4_007635-RA/size38995-processed-gene-0.49-mRNA-1//-1//CDS//3329541393//3508//frame0
MAKDQQVHDVNDRSSQQSSTADTGSNRSGTATTALSAGYQDSEEAFPFRVYDLLEDAERLGLDHIVSWVHGTNSFFVHDRDRFTNGIMPKYFAQSKYKSFQRQLNFYHFERERGGPNKDMFLGFKAQSAPNLLGLVVGGVGTGTTGCSGGATGGIPFGGTDGRNLAVGASLGLPMSSSSGDIARAMDIYSTKQQHNTTANGGGGDHASLDPSGDTAAVLQLKSPPPNDPNDEDMDNDQWVRQHGAHLSKYASDLVASVDPSSQTSNLEKGINNNDRSDRGEKGGDGDSSPPNSIEREIISTFRKDDDN